MLDIHQEGRMDNPEHWSSVVLALKERQRQREAHKAALQAEYDRLSWASIRARWLALNARIMGSQHVDKYIAIAEDRHRQYLSIMSQHMREGTY